MKRKVLIAAAALVGILSMSGCGGHSRQSIEEIREAAEAQRLCHEEGGSFVQWMDGLNAQQWYCNFDEEES